MEKLYDWARWFEGERTVLWYGVDYFVPQVVIYQQALTAAKKHGVTVRVVDGRDHITIWVEHSTSESIQG